MNNSDSVVKQTEAMPIDDDDSSTRRLVTKSPGQRADTMELTLRRIAHELRTPIGAIVSSADIMRSEAFGPLGDQRYKDYAASIGESADFALSVVTQAIDELGTLEQPTSADQSEFDVNPVIARSIEQLQPVADDARVILEASAAESELIVCSDPVKLQQIIINAVANGIKFSPVGSRVTIESEITGSTSARISIVDRGLGMGKAELNRIRQNKSESGQGYALIHRLSAQSRAIVTVNSVLGKGTTVRIELTTAAGA